MSPIEIALRSLPKNVLLTISIGSALASPLPETTIPPFWLFQIRLFSIRLPGLSFVIRTPPASEPPPLLVMLMTLTSAFVLPFRNSGSAFAPSLAPVIVKLRTVVFSVFSSEMPFDLPDETAAANSGAFGSPCSVTPLVPESFTLSL